MEYSSNPAFESLILIDNLGIEIQWTNDPIEDPTKKIEAWRRLDAILLRIRRVDAADMGVYKLYADNGRMSKEIKLTLQVEGVAHLLFITGVIKPGERATFVCNIATASNPTVSWSYDECEALTIKRQFCDAEKKLEPTVRRLSLSLSRTHTHSSPLKIVSFH